MDWLVEEGIGEHRAIQLRGGTIVAARLDWPGGLAAGQIEDAVLISRRSGSKRGTVRFASGEDALIDGLPGHASEGAKLRAMVTRAAIGEAGRFKLAQARPTQDAPRPAPSLAGRLREQGHAVQVVRRFPKDGDWDELFMEAWHGEIAFAGGSLTISPTPAMTLIDVDGSLPPAPLALAAIPAIAAALSRFDLGGSIGIDFPTLSSRDDRRAVDQALAATLTGWPHERTAINGFGFVQIVARLDRPSLLHRITRDRAGAAARLLLRRGERVDDPGALLLTAHPYIRAATGPAWEAELAHRTGRELRWRDDPSLALFGGFAQSVGS